MGKLENFCCKEFEELCTSLKGKSFRVGEGEISGYISFEEPTKLIHSEHRYIDISDGWNSYPELVFRFCPYCGQKQKAKEGVNKMHKKLTALEAIESILKSEKISLSTRVLVAYRGCGNFFDEPKLERLALNKSENRLVSLEDDVEYANCEIIDTVEKYLALKDILDIGKVKTAIVDLYTNKKEHTVIDMLYDYDDNIVKIGLVSE